jgi:hypothetical protein
MEAHLSALITKGDQFFVNANGVKYRTDLKTINEMKNQAGIFMLHSEYFDNKYQNFLDTNVDVKWSVNRFQEKVNLHKNHDLYNMRLIDIRTGLENSESMKNGIAIAKSGYSIEVCSFYEGSNNYYEFSKDQLKTISARVGNYQFSCISDEKLNYFNNRRSDFVGVLGHWIFPK